jgi:CheY-like chemotaxis protein
MPDITKPSSFISASRIPDLVSRIAFGIKIEANTAHTPPYMSTILILDDDADILELCSIILQGKGYTTVTATDCRNVIGKVMDAKPDVILIDNWIPDIGGIEACQLIKSNPDMMQIPVIFFSASNNVEAFATQAGADYALQKPFDIAELERLVDLAIRKSELSLQ